MDDQLLSGGNMGPVARVGDTVRREAGPWTSSVHVLLGYVLASGIDWVPEPFGLDTLGGEVLSVIPGEVLTI